MTKPVPATNELRSAWKAVNRHLNLVGIAYLIGALVMVAGARHGGWRAARALAWIAGIPAAYFCGFHDAELLDEPKPPTLMPEKPKKPEDPDERVWKYLDSLGEP